MPSIVLTAGEPAGIGPDICLMIAERVWSARLVVAADPDVLAERRRLLNLPVSLEIWDRAEVIPPHRPGTLWVAPFETREPVRCGTPSAANAQHVLDTLDFAASACLSGDFDAMVTGPVQKSVIIEAGVAFSGHTEYLAKRTGAPTPVMLLVADQLRVALATTHIPLAEVSRAITPGRLTAVLEVLHEDLTRRFGIDTPRILVCGLNPHAGEAGHIGREDSEVIAPVVEQLRARGLALRGPLPADTAFTPSALAGTDAVLAMYHDQGLPVVKHAGFGKAVNITLGLPIVRTSVDHGTALELAGSGRADASSLAAALELALELAAQSEYR